MARPFRRLQVSRNHPFPGGWAKAIEGSVWVAFVVGLATFLDVVRQVETVKALEPFPLFNPSVDQRSIYRGIIILLQAAAWATGAWVAWDGAEWVASLIPAWKKWVTVAVAFPLLAVALWVARNPHLRIVLVVATWVEWTIAAWVCMYLINWVRTKLALQYRRVENRTSWLKVVCLCGTCLLPYRLIPFFYGNANGTALLQSAHIWPWWQGILFGSALTQRRWDWLLFRPIYGSCLAFALRLMAGRVRIAPKLLRTRDCWMALLSVVLAFSALMALASLDAISNVAIEPYPGVVISAKDSGACAGPPSVLLWSDEKRLALLVLDGQKYANGATSRISYVPKSDSTTMIELCTKTLSEVRQMMGSGSAPAACQCP
ncbi:MAG: hypothetical protein WA294_07720 [Acidobacteriaceae bacterium]